MKEIEELISKVKRKIDRNNDKIAYYDDKKDNLSVHGHWDLGYFNGCVSQLDFILGELEDLSSSMKTKASSESGEENIATAQ